MFEKFLASLRAIKKSIEENLPKPNPNAEFHWEDGGYVRTTYKNDTKEVVKSKPITEVDLSEIIDANTITETVESNTVVETENTANT